MTYKPTIGELRRAWDFCRCEVTRCHHFTRYERALRDARSDQTVTEAGARPLPDVWVGVVRD